jgi:hypothetical protein
VIAAKPISPDVIDEIRRLKTAHAKSSVHRCSTKAYSTRIAEIVADFRSATLNRIAQIDARSNARAYSGR